MELEERVLRLNGLRNVYDLQVHREQGMGFCDVGRARGGVTLSINIPKDYSGIMDDGPQKAPGSREVQEEQRTRREMAGNGVFVKWWGLLGKDSDTAP
ncbi:hypothetical protein JZ751_018577 [Albula glossodonta]|uniref:Uncharacterized protein n=1 Tax=Albula glossodonta TaxID=121402 RepID=A0A8T2NM23_9TELE|nr:hypothetical protein JZ751_018577 [Albula glossodonta]